MLDGIMLIIVTMFAVLGAYFLSDILTDYVFRKNNAPRAVVILANENVEQVWNSIIDARSKIPDSEIIVLCTDEPAICESLEPALRGVHYANVKTLETIITSSLQSHLQDTTNNI